MTDERQPAFLYASVAYFAPESGLAGERRELVLDAMVGDKVSDRDV